MASDLCKRRLFPRRCEHVFIHPSSFLPVRLPVRSTRPCIFLQLLWQFKQSVYLFRERLAAPLVHVLGNTIWPQVLSVYLKPSVSVAHPALPPTPRPNSEPCFLSFHFDTHYLSRAEEAVFREEWETWERDKRATDGGGLSAKK